MTPQLKKSKQYPLRFTSNLLAHKCPIGTRIYHWPAQAVVEMTVIYLVKLILTHCSLFSLGAPKSLHTATVCSTCFHIGWCRDRHRIQNFWALDFFLWCWKILLHNLVITEIMPTWDKGLTLLSIARFSVMATSTSTDSSALTASTNYVVMSMEFCTVTTMLVSSTLSMPWNSVSIPTPSSYSSPLSLLSSMQSVSSWFLELPFKLLKVLIMSELFRILQILMEYWLYLERICARWSSDMISGGCFDFFVHLVDAFIRFDQTFFISDTSKFESFQRCSYLVSGAILCLFWKWTLRQYFQTAGLLFGQRGHKTGTLEHGEDREDSAAKSKNIWPLWNNPLTMFGWFLGCHGLPCPLPRRIDIVAMDEGTSHTVPLTDQYQDHWGYGRRYALGPADLETNRESQSESTGDNLMYSTPWYLQDPDHHCRGNMHYL